MDSAVAIPDLPSHLLAFTKNVRPVWKISLNELISKFTLAPLYFPFLSAEQVQQIRLSMGTNEGGKIHVRAGIVASRIPILTYFRYCPSCFQEQIKEFGEPYWMRMHQFSGVGVCLKHSCRLEETAAYFHPKEKHRFYAAISECSTCQTQHVDIKQPERRVVEYHKELMATPVMEGYGPRRWTLYYQELAKDLGFMHKSRVQHQEIFRCLRQVWSGSSLEPFLPEIGENDWLTNLFRKHRRSFHPLRHFMVMAALTQERCLSETLNRVKRLSEQKSSIQIFIDSGKSQHEIKKHRNEWLKLISDNAGYGVKKLRRLSSGGRIYAWLYRNDRSWLIQHCPAREISSKSLRVVDYPDWDRRNIIALGSVYDRLLPLEFRPRLTISHLIKQLPRSNSVQKHLSDLPLTKKWLHSHTECLEDYQVFRLKSAYRSLSERHQTIKRWKLIRVANIRKELITERIEQEIIALEMLGNNTANE